jgi:hypothetical protein
VILTGKEQKMLDFGVCALGYGTQDFNQINQIS